MQLSQGLGNLWLFQGEKMTCKVLKISLWETLSELFERHWKIKCSQWYCLAIQCEEEGMQLRQPQKSVNCSVVSDSLWPTRLLFPWNSPGKNTGVGCHSLLQGIFLTQGSNLCLLHWQADSLPSEPPRNTPINSINAHFPF